MQIDWTTFNTPGFLAAFILSLLFWVIDKIFVKPNLKIEIGKPSILSNGKLKVLNLKVLNVKRKVLFLLNHTATQVRIYIHLLDYPSKAEFNNIIARWNSSREPVTPDYANVDIGLALTNPREVLVPGEEGEVSVVVKKKDSDSCYPFNNHSYVYAKDDYLKPEWEIKDNKFIVRVEIQSAETQKIIDEFIVLNKGTIDSFVISKLIE